MVKKLKVGFFSFTCCEGCVVSFLEILNEKFFEWRDKVDILYLRALKKDGEIAPMDVAFVEGAVSTESEVRKLKLIRKNAGKLVAIGSGAINGWPSNFRNNFKGEKKKRVDVLVKKMGQIKKVLPLKDVVKVDDEVPGCPIDEKIFIEKMERLMGGRG
ncbi:MAG: hypothetical protein V1889_03115 [archaeon]